MAVSDHLTHDFKANAKRVGGKRREGVVDLPADVSLNHARASDLMSIGLELIATN